MLLFQNKQSRNYFSVDSITGKITHATNGDIKCFTRYEYMFGKLEVLVLTDILAVNQFRKALSKDVNFKNLPFAETKAHLVENYPEFFI